MELYFFFQSRPGADPDFLKRGDKQGGPNPNFPSFLKVFRQNGNLPPPVDCQSEIDCAPSPVLNNPVLDVSISQKILYRTGGGRNETLFNDSVNGQEEEEMKLCLMILSVPWYMFNDLEHAAILSPFFNIHNRKQFQSFN